MRFTKLGLNAFRATTPLGQVNFGTGLPSSVAALGIKASVRFGPPLNVKNIKMEWGTGSVHYKHPFMKAPNMRR